MSNVSGARSGVTTFVHVGLVVEDLDQAVAFLTLLGFDCSTPSVYSGAWIDRIIAVENATVEVVMARGPDGSDIFEVVRFHSPTAGAPESVPAANRPGCGTSPSRSMTCEASSTGSERLAGKRSVRSLTTRTPTSSATYADPKG